MENSSKEVDQYKEMLWHKDKALEVICFSFSLCSVNALTYFIRRHNKDWLGLAKSYGNSK
jgi:hypothetical protein